MPDDIVIRFSVRDDGTPVIERLNKKIKETQKETGALAPGVESLNKRWGDFISANTGLITVLGAAAGALIAVGAAAAATYNSYQQYAQQVRDIAAISDTSAEETSKFLQVLDDFQISAQDVTAAARVMTQNGLVPNIETLAKLSDEYLAIQDPMERNEFILKNLGRAGLQWVNVLQQGGDALRNMSDDVSKNLILSDEQIRKAEEQRLAMDALSDTWEGFKIQVGAAVGEVILWMKRMDEQSDKLSSARQNAARSMGLTTEQFARYSRSSREAQQHSERLIKAFERGAEMTRYYSAQVAAMGRAHESVVPKIQMSEEEIKRITEESQRYLSLVGSITDETKSYQERQAELAKEHEELLAQKQLLLSQGWHPEGQKIQEINEKLAENEDAMKKNTDEFELNGRRRILSMLEQQLAIDGLSTKEMNYLLTLGKQWGVYSDEAVEAAQKAMQEIDDLKARLDNIPEKKYVDIVVSTSGSTSDILRERDVASAKGYATGTHGWMTVPPGYPNDTYPIMLSSGERFAVVPQAQAQPTPANGGPANGGAGMDTAALMPILQKFADEIARANRAVFEKVGRR